MHEEPDQAVLTERLTFVWVIRDEQQISWISTQLEHAASIAPPGLLRIKIFCTGRKKDLAIDVLNAFPPSPTTLTDKQICSTTIYDITYGRPNFAELLEEQVQGSDYTDWLAIGACVRPSSACDLSVEALE
jgi:ferric-chelate reductase